jgi:hypothetical protein
MELIIAILAGICPDWWPRRPHWPGRPPIWWPWPPPPPPVGPGDPDPILPGRPRPEPWTLISGILCGVGGAIAWLVVGREFGGDGSFLLPAVTGFLGGTTAGWLVDSARDLTGRR